MEIFVQLLISGLVNGAIYGLIAIGFVLIYKCSAVLNFAQGNMVLIGAYIFWFFKGPMGFDLFPALLFCIFFSFLFGMIIERLTLRPLVGQSLLSMITVTIFLSLVIEGVACIIWGSSPLSKVAIFPKGSIQVASFNLMTDNIISFCFAFLVMIILILFFKRTRLGLAMRGVAEGHHIVQSFGVNVKRILTISWGIAGVAGALGGIVLADKIGFELGLSHIGIAAIPAAFIGGLESLFGAIIGGLIIGLIESVVSGYLGNAAGTPAVYLLLVIVMLFKPYGLFGLTRIERV
ncbi:MAG: branched-chain amino acid ABC transporter permease [Desulfobacterales bacterium]|nr:MAG: branched-chain amino acid ABC transporter permease [Desulfobacterales bacterium]